MWLVGRGQEPGDLDPELRLSIECGLHPCGHETLVEPKRDERLFHHWPKLSWASAIHTKLDGQIRYRVGLADRDQQSAWSLANCDSLGRLRSSAQRSRRLEIRREQQVRR